MSSMIFFGRKAKSRAKKDRSIPSTVLFNHFFAITYCISCDDDRYKLKKVPFYNEIRMKSPVSKIKEIRKLLWNSWSTEYAYRIGEIIDNKDYYKFSLHWNFPQAYYCVYLSMTAFHETQGIANEQHEKSIKLFGNSVKDNHYPSAMSFYTSGLKDEFKYSGLPNVEAPLKKKSALSKVQCLEDAEYQVATFLKTTRERNAIDKRERLKKTNDKRFWNLNDEFRKKFNKTHWNKIYVEMPVTSVLNLLYRLRIKANYRDIESFVHANIDFKHFHSCLGELVDYLNFVHEAYVVKAIGNKDYEKILKEFPSHLNDKSAVRRYNEIIKKI